MFDISKIDTTKYAQSLGLVLIPRIRFLQKHEKLLKEREEKLKRKSELVINAAQTIVITRTDHYFSMVKYPI